MDTEDTLSIIITIILLAAITALLAAAYFHDNDLKFFKQRCEAQDGIVVILTDGFACVSKKILIEKQKD